MVPRNNDFAKSAMWLLYPQEKVAVWLLSSREKVDGGYFVAKETNILHSRVDLREGLEKKWMVAILWQKRLIFYIAALT